MLRDTVDFLQKSGNREQGTVGRIRVFGHKINLILTYARGLVFIIAFFDWMRYRYGFI
jgi:hypothetical protein